MRNVAILLFGLWLSVVPTFAKGGHGGHGRSSAAGFSSHSSGARSYGSSRSYRSRSSSSSYRSHTASVRSYRSRPSYGGYRVYRAPSSRSRRTTRFSSGGRDKHGRISRSEAAKDSFKRQHPCPATGRSRGACPGYVIDHVKPLAKGGADSPSNMQWQTKAAAKEKDKWERR